MDKIIKQYFRNSQYTSCHFIELERCPYFSTGIKLHRCRCYLEAKFACFSFLFWHAVRLWTKFTKRAASIIFPHFALQKWWTHTTPIWKLFFIAIPRESIWYECARQQHKAILFANCNLSEKRATMNENASSLGKWFYRSASISTRWYFSRGSARVVYAIVIYRGFKNRNTLAIQNNRL